MCNYTAKQWAQSDKTLRSTTGGTSGVSIYFALSYAGKFTSEWPILALLFVCVRTIIYNTHYSTCQAVTLCTRVQMNAMSGVHCQKQYCLSFSQCVIYVISKTEVITTKLFCRVFLCRGEAEVVSLFHATVHHKHHDFRHARWCKLTCAIRHVLPTS